MSTWDWEQTARSIVDALGRPLTAPLPRDVGRLAAVLEQAARMRDELEAVDRRYPTLVALALLATRPWGDEDPAGLGIEDEDQEAFLLPLAVALAVGWQFDYPRDPRDRDRLTALAVRRGVSPEEVKVELLARAVPLAQLDRDRRRSVRLGRTWMKNADGTKREDVAPRQELPWDNYLRMWRAAVYRAAREMLRDEAEDAVTSRPEFQNEARDVPDVTLLDACRGAERAGQLIADLEENATPRQHEVLDAIREALAQEPDASYGDLRRAAAERLGIGLKGVEMALGRLWRASG